MSGHQIAGVGQEVRMIDPYRIDRIENRYQVGSDPLVFVDMPAQEPGEPFVIKLQIKEAAGVVDKYRDALT